MTSTNPQAAPNNGRFTVTIMNNGRIAASKKYPGSYEKPGDRPTIHDLKEFSTVRVENTGSSVDQVPFSQTREPGLCFRSSAGIIKAILTKVLSAACDPHKIKEEGAVAVEVTCELTRECPGPSGVFHRQKRNDLRGDDSQPQQVLKVTGVKWIQPGK